MSDPIIQRMHEAIRRDAYRSIGFDRMMSKEQTDPMYAHEAASPPSSWSPAMREADNHATWSATAAAEVAKNMVKEDRANGR